MLFPTIDFAVFFLVVFTGSWLLRPHKVAWKVFILCASFFFYGYWFSSQDDLPITGLLAFSIVVNWAFGQAVFAAMTPDGERTQRSRRLVRAAVIVDLGVLGYFKYVNFFLDSFTARLTMIGVHLDGPFVNVLLPIGISFFTFQAISYVIDIGRGVWRRPVGLLDFAVYLSFFAHLVAGPIVRASEFIPQLDAGADPRYVPTAEPFMLIFRGLFKKIVISSFMATIADPVFALPQDSSSWQTLWGIYAYAIQIYADFSGYTDIAIGVALLLGIRFPQNFNAPYRALSLQDFWRRWHMTLSRWLRDYLYIPLGGNRGSELFTYRNLFLTMVIGGLWHGAHWTFVIWGVSQGGYLVGERVVKQAWARRGAMGLPPPLVKVLQWVLTFNVVCLSWVFFRARSMGGAFEVLGRLIGDGGSSAMVTPLVIGTVLAMLASQFVPQRIPEAVTTKFARAAPVVQILVLGAGLVLIDALGPEGIAPFIYYQF
jgi:D-alanyl-lipoteichoic acid acyltransferase DltB (MBOAT superfamily)